MGYQNIKSKFVRQELQRTHFKDRDYIDDLMTIEQLAQGEYFGLGTGYISLALKARHPQQWKAIHLELCSEDYKDTVRRERRERAKERKEEAVFQKQETLELQKDKKEWSKLGGKG